jgi:hypothetical protein
MYSALLHSHSGLRYLLLLTFVVVLVQSLRGWLSKSEFTPMAAKISLVHFALSHTQLLLGLILYFVSPNVQFGADAMKIKGLRYWTVEHITMMIIAIVLVTMGHIIAKKKTQGFEKYKSYFIFNLAAIAVVLIALIFSGRGIV